MKKNWTMRVAVALLALTMITSCFVGSTFAKYVTKAQGEDNARVAKWGILLTVEGNAFATQYEAENQDYIDAGGEYSVVASNEDQVVAPGTNSEQVGQTLVATVTGTPEVATRYAMTGTVTDVVLPAGTYTDYTELVKADDGTYGYTGTFTLAKDYTPILWNLEIEGKGRTFDVATELYNALSAYPALLQAAENLGFSENGCSFFSAVKILEKVASKEEYVNIINAALGNVVSGGRNFMLEVDGDTFTLSYDFDPNKEMDFTFTLSWEWAFEQEDVELYDKADTYLGNIAAGIDDIVVPDGASINISATLTASATQID